MCVFVPLCSIKWNKVLAIDPCLKLLFVFGSKGYYFFHHYCETTALSIKAYNVYMLPSDYVYGH